MGIRERKSVREEGRKKHAKIENQKKKMEKIKRKSTCCRTGNCYIFFPSNNNLFRNILY